MPKYKAGRPPGWEAFHKHLPSLEASPTQSKDSLKRMWLRQTSRQSAQRAIGFASIWMEKARSQNSPSGWPTRTAWRLPNWLQDLPSNLTLCLHLSTRMPFSVCFRLLLTRQENYGWEKRERASPSNGVAANAPPGRLQRKAAYTSRVRQDSSSPFTYGSEEAMGNIHRKLHSPMPKKMMERLRPWNHFQIPGAEARSEEHTLNSS